MTNLEIALNILAEASATELSKQRDPKGFHQQKKVAKEGGSVAKAARKQLESKLGRSIIANAEGNSFMAGMYKDMAFDKQMLLENNTNEIVGYEAENRNYNRLLNTNSSIKDVFKRLSGKMELEEIRELFLKVIDKVYIYNGGKRKDVIRILFKNGNRCEVIYSSSLMRGKYIKLNEPLYYDNEKNVISSRIFPMAISEKGMITWHTNKNGKVYDDDASKFRVELERVFGNTNYQIFEEGFSVETFIRLVRNTGLALPYHRLVQEPEIAKEQREHYKEWRKKYNTGNPTSQPYVLRNETYEEIKTKRRKLYHRREKIKRNKSMSSEEKEKELADTKRKLDILTLQVPTFGLRKNGKHKKEE